MNIQQNLSFNFPKNVPPHPMDHLKHLAQIQQLDILSESFADFMDQHDEIGHVRQEFFYPRMKDIPEGTWTFSTFQL